MSDEVHIYVIDYGTLKQGGQSTLTYMIHRLNLVKVLLISKIEEKRVIKNQKSQITIIKKHFNIGPKWKSTNSISNQQDQIIVS